MLVRVALGRLVGLVTAVWLRSDVGDVTAA